MYLVIEHSDTRKWIFRIENEQRTGKWWNKVKKVKNEYREGTNMIRPWWGPNIWPKVVKEIVRERGREEWKRGLDQKSSLKWYKKDRPKVDMVYDGSWSSSLLFGARSGSLPLRDRTGHWEDGGRACQRCNQGEIETILHAMVECEAYQIPRARMLQEVRALSGIEVSEVYEGREEEGLIWLLGMGEWENENLRRRICKISEKFLRDMWIMRGQ